MNVILKYIVATIVVVLSLVAVTNLVNFVVQLFVHGQLNFGVNQAIFYSFWIAMVTALLVICIGIPVYLLFMKYGILTISNLAVAGFVVPVLVFILLDAFVFNTTGRSSGHTFYGIYRQMVIDGDRTLWGWIRVLHDSLFIAVYGLLGAVVFGLAMRYLKARGPQ